MADIETKDEVAPVRPTTALEFLIDLNQFCHFQSREGKKVDTPSNSELRRWIQNKSFLVNGESVEIKELIDFPVFSVALFPKNRVTLL